MRISPFITFIIFALVSCTVFSSDRNALQIAPHDNEVSFADLQILGTALGVSTESFDYEAEQPHCVHFTVEISERGFESDQLDARGACGLVGPHRITFQWREKDEEIGLHFHLIHREKDSYYIGFSGPTFNKPIGANGTNSAPLTTTADFAYGQQLELTHREYVSSGVDEATGEYFREVEVSITVFVELRSNPGRKIGSE